MVILRIHAAHARLTLALPLPSRGRGSRQRPAPAFVPGIPRCDLQSAAHFPGSPPSKSDATFPSGCPRSIPAAVCYLGRQGASSATPHTRGNGKWSIDRAQEWRSSGARFLLSHLDRNCPSVTIPAQLAACRRIPRFLAGQQHTSPSVPLLWWEGFTSKLSARLPNCRFEEVSLGRTLNTAPGLRNTFLACEDIFKLQVQREAKVV
jgi:hypothetical protein